ncbi:MAG: DUF4375 domain-containing protein [Phycisphaeraceae bacterium]|nr:DUF4375 domain-containing protein [Phycisphaeraceae bacterium]
MWWILLIAVAMLCAVVAAHLLRKRSPRKAMKAFAKAIVGSSAFSKSMSEMLSERSKAIDAANAAPPPTAVQIPGLVHQLISNNELESYVADIRLKKAGKRAESELLRVLGDKRVTWDKQEGNDRWGSPAERVSRALWRLNCRELGERIGHLWDHSDWRVFTQAIRAKAALGRACLSDWAIAILDDHDSENCSMKHNAVADGVERAVQEGWAEREFIARLLSWAEANIVDTARRPSKWAIQFCAANGGSRAIQILQSPELLSLNNDRNLHFILDELNKHGVVISPDFARRTIDKSLVMEAWPWPWTFKPALIALARVYPQEAIEIASAQFERTKGPLASNAIDFVRAQLELPMPWATDPPPDMVLSTEEKAAVEVLNCACSASGEIGNGGLSQYFFNPSGDHWERDARAFETIGGQPAADAMRKAAHVVSPSGAAEDRETRIKQYAALSESKEKELDALSWACTGNHLEAAELRFMIKHGELFRRVREARRKAGMDVDSDGDQQP